MKKILQIILGILLVVGIIVTYYLFFPLGPQNESVSIIVPKGANARTIADTLKKHHVISSVLALRGWLKVTGTDKDIQAGKIVFYKGEGVIKAAKKLFDADPIEKTVTIPEGMTIEQTMAQLSGTIEFDTTTFITLCYDTVFIRSVGVQGNSLEGYLFPNTYRFAPKASAEAIIRKMVKEFFVTYNNLNPDNEIITDYSSHELVTLASIVEKEAQLASERTRIAGVFHNRLRLGYPLGADPTVRYAVKKFNGPLYVSDLNSPSPYNTRRFAGLPPGPICSPGKASLQATVSPMETEDLYFVAKWDGTGAHDFSKTNAEHTRKKLLIRHQNKQRNKQKEAE